MNKIITDYRNLPGEHCGSSAMRSLLAHYCGLDISEAAAFGLGSGLEMLVIESKRGEPATLLFGRNATMEIDLAMALGVNYQEVPEFDDDKAWQVVRQEIIEDRPCMLSGDIFYLDYREFKAHFPAHRFVLVGFDDEKNIAYLADREDAEPVICSLPALARSRNTDATMSTFNLWGKFHDTKIENDMPTAFRLALHKNAARMLGHDTTQADMLRMLAGKSVDQITTGLAGLRRYLELMPTWQEREDGQTIAFYAGQCIEKFGTGGGNFRKIYAAYLREGLAIVPEIVTEKIPSLAEQSAALWTELSNDLDDFAKTGSNDVLKQGKERLARILDLETELFETLAERISQG